MLMVTKTIKTLKGRKLSLPLKTSFTTIRTENSTTKQENEPLVSPMLNCRENIAWNKAHGQGNSSDGQLDYLYGKHRESRERFGKDEI